MTPRAVREVCLHDMYINKATDFSWWNYIKRHKQCNIVRCYQEIYVIVGYVSIICHSSLICVVTQDCGYVISFRYYPRIDLTPTTHVEFEISD